MKLRVRDVALACAVLTAAGANSLAAVVVNEIMYNSIEATDVEFVELTNTGPSPVDLSYWYLIDDTDGHTPCLLSGSLQPGGYLVVAGNISRFTSKYPGVTNLNPTPFDDHDGTVGWALGNNNDKVRVFDSMGLLVDSVHFTDGSDGSCWPKPPDGTGPSLELTHPALDNSLCQSWRASATSPTDGTPGARNSVYHQDAAPLVETTRRSIALPTSADGVTITSRVTDDGGVAGVTLFVNEGSGYQPRPMFDDGLHGDELAGDSIYGAQIVAHTSGTVVRYYISATDALPQTTLDPPLAPAEYFGYTVGYRPPSITVNEILPRNVTGIVDEAGQHEDWLELRNREPRVVDLAGMYLTDNLLLTRAWKFPAGAVIAPGGYLRVWCDNDQSQGPLHASFKLGAGGGEVGLLETMDHGNVPVHALTFGPAAADVAFGFLPEDSDAPEYLLVPTPGGTNAPSSYYSPVCLNEFMTTGTPPAVDDWVELYNRGPVSQNISGWHLSDEIGNTLKYTFPPGTVIAPGGYLSVDEPQLGFGFSSDGSEVIVLTAPDGTTGEDYFDYGPQGSDVSQGRWPNGTPNWRFFQPPTRTSANSCASTPILGAVTGLRVTRNAAGLAELVWDASAGVERYDVIKGDLPTLLSTRGDFAASVGGCLENNSADTHSWDGATIPSGGVYYLVRAAALDCRTGTWGDGTEYRSRDAGVNSAPAGCP